MGIYVVIGVGIIGFLWVMVCKVFRVGFSVDLMVWWVCCLM